MNWRQLSKTSKRFLPILLCFSETTSKEKVEDIVDRATVVLESMNRDKWAEGGAVGLHYEYLLVA